MCLSHLRAASGALPGLQGTVCGEQVMSEGWRTSHVRRMVLLGVLIFRREKQLIWPLMGWGLNEIIAGTHCIKNDCCAGLLLADLIVCWDTLVNM